MRADLAKLTCDVEILGRETRRKWAEMENLPAAVAAAVVEAIDPQLRELRKDVDALKCAG